MRFLLNGSCLLWSLIFFVACSSSETNTPTDDSTYTEEDNSIETSVETESDLPEKGVITTLEEVSPEEFLVTEEIEIPEPEGSLVIAHYLDNTSDTLTLRQIKHYHQEDYQVREHSQGSRMGSLLQTIAVGYFGYAMLRNFSGLTPSSNVYRDRNVYNRSTSRSPYGKSSGVSSQPTSTNNSKLNSNQPITEPKTSQPAEKPKASQSTTTTTKPSRPTSGSSGYGGSSSSSSGRSTRSHGG